MLVIVEGMDNTGKSTLAQYLAEKYKWLLMANKQRPRSMSEAVRYTTIVEVNSRLFPTVVDRMPAISEQVYGPILRNENLAEEIPIHASLLIYCRPPDEVILNFKAQEQMSGVVEHARQLTEAYDKLMSWLPHIKFDYTNPQSLVEVETACSKM